jgi:hypothetical protein
MSKLPLIALLVLPLGAAAQPSYTYRCTTADGKKYYGATIPSQCVGRPVEQLSPQGTVLKRFDPEGDEKARLAKEAEAIRKKEEDALLREETRRNRALLATYSSERDIDEARARALKDNEKQIKEIQARIGEIKKRQAGYAKEMEFYTEGVRQTDKKKGSAPAPKAAAKAPPKLLEDVRNTEIQLSAQENLLSVKQKEVDSINAKYDEDLRRYLDLTGKTPGARAKALGVDKGVVVESRPGSKYDERRNQMDAQRRAEQERMELERIDREREAARRRAEQRR